jgi:acetyl esterase/lipase
MIRMRPVLAAALCLGLSCTFRAFAGDRYVDPIFANVTKTSDIVYGQAVNSSGALQDLTLDLYEPSGDTEEFRPVYIWAHGGFHKRGDKRNDGPYADYASRGWVTLSINYRLCPACPDGAAGILSSSDPVTASELFIAAARDDQHDMQAAVRWVRANAARLRIDAGRISVGGYSAGAETALTTAFNSYDPGNSGNPGYPSDVAAAVSHAGVYQFGSPVDCPGTNLCTLYGTIGPTPNSLTTEEPPVAMIHGTNDMTLPFPVILPACALTTALLNVCEITPVVGAGHVIADTDVALAFIDKYVVDSPRMATTLTLGPGARSGPIGNSVPVSATLTAGGVPLARRRVVFSIGSAEAAAVTGDDGVAATTIFPVAPAGVTELSATYSGEMTSAATLLGPGSGYAGSRDEAAFEVD